MMKRALLTSAILALTATAAIAAPIKLKQDLTTTKNMTVTGTGVVTTPNLVVGSSASTLKKLTFGSVTLVAGTAVVADTSITANSKILLTSNADETLHYTLNAGVGFTVDSDNVSSTASVSYLRLQP